MRDNKISNSSTTTVTDESLPLRDAQVNVATPNPLEGEELITKSVFRRSGCASNRAFTCSNDRR